MRTVQLAASIIASSVLGIVGLGCAGTEVSEPDNDGEENLSTVEQAVESCVTNPVCPSGSTYNASVNKCVKPMNACPVPVVVGACTETTTWSSYSSPVVAVDFSGTTDYCRYTWRSYREPPNCTQLRAGTANQPYVRTCPTGTTKMTVAGGDLCTVPGNVCPTGRSFCPADDKCYLIGNEYCELNGPWCP